MNETELIRGCINQKREAQRLLYETYSRKMMSVCMRYSDSRETAEDILQEGFIKVFGAIDTFNFSGSFEGWIRRIIVNTALEYLRKNDVMRQTVDLDTALLDAEVSSTAIDHLSVKELMSIIDSLPFGFRTVFNMYAVEGYSHKEIGDALGIEESTSRSQYTRAKKMIQKKLIELEQ